MLPKRKTEALCFCWTALLYEHEREKCTQVDFGSELEAALAGSADDEDDSGDEALLAAHPQLRAALSRRRAERESWRAAAAEWMQGAMPQGRGEPLPQPRVEPHAILSVSI